MAALKQAIELTPGSTITIMSATGEEVTVTAPAAKENIFAPKPLTLTDATEMELRNRLVSKFDWTYTNPIAGLKLIIKKS